MIKQVMKIGLGVSIVASTLLAAPEKTKLKIGFIALTDCAPLVIAKEKGFFKAEGLDVHVSKEGGGWPGIQQKGLVYKLFQLMLSYQLVCQVVPIYTFE